MIALMLVACAAFIVGLAWLIADDPLETVVWSILGAAAGCWVIYVALVVSGR